MGKKKKKKFQRVAEIHSHQHEDFMEHLINEGETPRDRHVMPMQQGGHIGKPWCWCRPEVVFQHPLTFHRVYSHRLLIH